MAHIKLMVQIMPTSGLVEDAAVNVLHFSASVAATGAAAIATDIAGWYSTVANIYSGQVAQNGHRYKMYDMADPEPRAPILSGTFNLSVLPNGTPQASEVAICLSFQGNRTSGVSQARRRGRIYIGPLDNGNTDSDGRPTSTAVTAVKNMGALILSDSESDANYEWVVYSTVDDTLVPVTNGWVDNAYDIQRRRGVAPTSRTLFP